jgi:hemolysin activation/secretion protein
MQWSVLKPFLLSCVLVMLGITSALAQDVTAPTERGERGIVIAPANPSVLPTDGETKAVEVIRPVLPVLPEQLPAAGSLGVEQIFIRELILEDSTVLSESDFNLFSAEYENRSVAATELYELCSRLSEVYVQRGYVNSGVVLPDQQVSEGVVRLQAIEGGQTRLEIVGNDRLRDYYIEGRLKRGVDSPLNVNDLRGALQQVQSDPRVDQVNASLLPGATAGDSLLRVEVEEASNYWIRAAFDNYRSPAVGEYSGELSAGTRNLTGLGDSFVFNYGLTEGLNEIDTSYSMPLTAADLSLNLYYRKSRFDIVEEPFDVVDIETKVSTIGGSFSRPFRWGLGNSLIAAIGFENRKADNKLLGIPFSFTPGEEDGKSEASVAYLSGEWVFRSAKQVFGVSATARVGVDVLDPTIHSDAPDSRYVAYLGQVQYARNLDWRSSQLVLRTATQIASEPLLAIEKYSVGGHSSVRGYRENQFVRDNGVIASVEYQLPVFVDADGFTKHGLFVVPFFDYGVAWDSDNDLQTSDKDDIASVGVGLRWQPLKGLFVRADYGYALDDIDTPDDSLQDDGVQFRIEYTFSP